MKSNIFFQLHHTMETTSAQWRCTRTGKNTGSGDGNGANLAGTRVFPKYFVPGTQQSKYLNTTATRIIHIITVHIITTADGKSTNGRFISPSRATWQQKHHRISTTRIRAQYPPAPAYSYPVHRPTAVLEKNNFFEPHVSLSFQN